MQHESEEVRSTLWMKKLFTDELTWAECFWARAIGPATYACFEQEEYEDGVTTINSENLPAVVKAATKVGTDGSGGPAYCPKSRRRFASAAVFAMPDKEKPEFYESVAVAASGVPGRQTVPRAEVWAGMMAQALKGNENEEATLLSDSRYFVQGSANPVSRKLKEGTNGDLWEEWEANLPSSLQVCKVKAHNERGVLRGDVCIDDFIHNALADATADAMSEALSDSPASLQVSKAEGMSFAIALRIAVLEREARENTAKEIEYPVRALKQECNDAKTRTDEMLQRIQERGHSLLAHGNKTICTRCKKHRRRLEKWTSFDCIGHVTIETSSQHRELRATLEKDTVIVDTTRGTPAQRKRAAAKINSALRERTRARAQKEKDAIQAAQQRIQAASLPEASEKMQLELLPFDINPSHTDIIHLGGFAACAACGKVASQERKSNSLVEPCRKWIPKGSKSRIQRMMQGKHPYGDTCWPDGSDEPRPRRVKGPTP